MSKPDWKDAPEWANYLAQDSDGLWFWYELEPVAMRVTWSARGGKARPGEPRSQQWEQTLERRP